MTSNVTSMPRSQSDFWLFGYGSLIWKPCPHYDERVSGYITGYVRRFWQASEDHRGTPADPGRVVTLIQKSFWETLDDEQTRMEDDKVWGVAYHIPVEKVKEVQEYLDIREVNGYSIQYTPFHPADRSRPDINCMVYIGMPDNPQFLGALRPADVARKINESVGPSGENRDYLLNLHAALKELSTDSHDEHISDLASRVLLMKPRASLEADVQSHSASLRKFSSAQVQEEVEGDTRI